MSWPGAVLGMLRACPYVHGDRNLGQNDVVTTTTSAEPDATSDQPDVTTDQDPSIDPDVKLLPAWKVYELDVQKHLKSIDRLAKIEHNVKREGQASKALRQIDVLAENTVVGEAMRIVVECKAYKNPLDVGKVDEFVGKLMDVRANLGLLYAVNGVTPAARRRAENSHLPQVRIRDISHITSDVASEQTPSPTQSVVLEDDWPIIAAEALGYEKCPSGTCEPGVAALYEWAPGGIEAGRCDSCGSLVMKCQECECLNLVEVGTNSCYCCDAEYHVGHDGKGEPTDIAWVRPVEAHEA